MVHEYECPFDFIPTVPFQLPQSIYTSALMVFVGVSEEEFKSLETWLVILPQCLLLLLNIVIQIGFICYIRNLTEDIDDECNSKISLPLMYLAVGIFGCGMVQEFVENLEMLGWTCYVKTEETHQKLSIVTSFDGKKKALSTGLTRFQKIMFVGAVIFPKVVIAVLFTQCGIKFVALSETDKDVVLNCLAMIFVIEVDDLLYHTFTPPFIRDVLGRLPPIDVDSQFQTRYNLIATPLFKLAIWSFLGFLFVGYYVCTE